MNTALRIENLSKTYRGSNTPAVHCINLDISSGTFFGLLGPNGAGKTSTISMICGYIQPSGGRISIEGKNIKEHRAELKQMIGVVPQDIALYPSLTAYENLHFFGNIYGMKGKPLQESISHYLNIFGLEPKTREKVSGFSGGMKRRLNLIAGILHQPKVLFLDEPTVGIDVQSRAIINDFLKELNQQGTTIIYTSHHLEEAEKMCTEIAIIDYGKIILQGTPSGLIQDHPPCLSLEEVFLHHTGRKLRD